MSSFDGVNIWGHQSPWELSRNRFSRQSSHLGVLTGQCCSPRRIHVTESPTGGPLLGRHAPGSSLAPARWHGFRGGGVDAACQLAVVSSEARATVCVRHVSAVLYLPHYC